MLDVADVLQLVIDRLDKGPLPEQYLVVEVHQRVFHVLLDFGDEMNVVNEEHLEEVLADVSPVSEDFPEEFLREVPVLQRFSVIRVPWREHPLDDFALLVDDQVQLESVEPPHRAFAFCRPSLHGLVRVHSLDVAAHQRG